MRREAKLRQAREWFTQDYFVDSMEDSNRIAPPGSQEGMYAVWERVKLIVPTIREKYRMNRFLANLEKATQRFEKWAEKQSPGNLETMRQFMQQMRSAKAQKASA